MRPANTLGFEGGQKRGLSPTHRLSQLDRQKSKPLAARTTPHSRPQTSRHPTHSPSCRRDTSLEPPPPTGPEETPKPPPIFVKNLLNFNLLCYDLSTLVGGENFTCQAQVYEVIIKTANPDSYRGTVKYLKGKNASYHTYQMPEGRGFRVVLRGLQHTTPTDFLNTSITLFC